MIVLSCFDGMSCGQIALRELGFPVGRYYASEIDKFAIHNTQFNFPDTIQLGDITKWRAWDIPWADIGMLLGGSPCQDVSFAGRQEGLKDGTRSNLFFTWMEILRHIQKLNPGVKFLLENVKMKKEFLRRFNETLGLYPVLINSSLVSAQNRTRYYWTNIRTRREGLFGDVYTDIPQPTDRKLLLKDILENGVPEKYYLKESSIQKLLDFNKRMKDNGNGFLSKFHDGDGKMDALRIGVKNVVDLVKERVAGISVTGGGLRPHQGDSRKSGVSEFGTIGCRDTKSVTLTASWPPAFVNRDIMDFARPKGEAVLCPKRTENAKLNRKEYENGRVKERWADRRRMEPRADGKTNSLTSVQKDNLLMSGFRVRRLTPHECCRLQTIPDWYKWDVSETQQYKMLGNGWTVDVIKHILSFMEIK